MKTFVLSAASIVLMSILFCPMVMAAPSMPPDLQIAEPDPSLPKELSAFFGKWEGTGKMVYFLIVEKIDGEKASLWVWEYSNSETLVPDWAKYEAQVIKMGKNYKLQYRSRFAGCEVMLKGEGLNWSRTPYESVRLKRVQ